MEPVPTAGREWAWRLGILLKARVTLALVLVVAWLFVAVEALGGVDRLAWWYLEFGLRRDDVLAGKIWQVATHALLHGTWLHLGLNAALLWWCGARVEHMLGGRALLKVLGWSVLGGAAAHLLLAPAGHAPLVGLSGGVMGLLLLITTLSPQSRMLLMPVSARNLGLGVLIAAGLLALCHPELGIPVFAKLGAWCVALGGGPVFDVGHACHFGGALTGWLLARTILRPRVSLAELRAQRRRRERRQGP
jgi:membrane associated rhomboid family serine protease